MRPIYRGIPEVAGHPTILVAECEPQCRTIMVVGSSGLSDFYFLSIPYLIFVVAHGKSLEFLSLEVYFHRAPLRSPKILLSLTCFPNCRQGSTGLVCLGDLLPSGDSEEALMRSTVDTFWGTAFTRDDMGDHIDLSNLEHRTRFDRGVGMTIDWRTTGANQIYGLYSLEDRWPAVLWRRTRRWN